MSRWDDSRAAFAEAADWFVRTTTWVGGRWSDPGLGEWDVRALVGHTSRALLTVEAADLATAIGLPLDVPPRAAAEALEIVSELALREGLAGPLLRTATGRQPGPGGFSVL